MYCHAFISNIMTSIKERIHRFAKAQGGGVAILIGFAIIPLVGFVGVATDATRAYMVKSRLSSAIDAAGLAGGQNFYEPTRDADIKMFFDVNYPANYMGTTVTGPDIVANEDNETLTLTASAKVPMVFMQIFGQTHVTVDAFAEITREMQALDVVLAIDMSGSMGSSLDGGTRIGAARQAANDLVDILFGGDAAKELLNIGLVPWNGKVNITLDGTTYDPDALTTDNVGSFTNPVSGVTQSTLYTANNSPVPLLFEPDSAWKGCVYSRYIDDGFEDTNADTLLPPTDAGSADWLGWQPIGKEGEPLAGDGSEIAIVQSQSASNYDNGITVTLSNAPKPGNILIAVGTRRSWESFNRPGGWNSLMNYTADNNGDGQRIRFMAHLVGAGEDASYSFTANDSRQQAMTLIEVEGLSWDNLELDTDGSDHTTSNGQSISLDSVYVNRDGALLIAGAAFRDDDLSNFSWSNSFNQIANVEQIGGTGEDLTHSVAARIISNDGSYSTTFSAASGTGEERWGGMVALRPASRCTGTVTGSECTPCLSHGITTLQNSKAAIKDAINALTGPQGTTNITQGVGWAWRVLKPTAPFTQAVADPDYQRQQAIVLLTDGENFGGDGDGYKTVFGSGASGQAGMNERLLKIAANIKADGVVLYVIQFANSGTALQTLLKTVASGPDTPFYHYAPDQTALKQVFREIANHLSELRLSR